MNKYIKILLFTLVLVTSCSRSKETSLNRSEENKFVKKIAKTPNADLATMTFFELNILKNAVFSLQGFKYADDRPWLYDYFYKYSGPEKKDPAWNLHLQYIHPGSIEFTFDENMKKAVANLRVALFQKIRSIDNINEIDKIIDEEFIKHNEYIFGRKIKYGDQFKESIRREIHGYNRIIKIIDERSSFDASELLGVYLGNIILLKQVIEAQNGKVFKGVLGWEISQLIGITPENKKYDFENISAEEKEKLKILDKVINLVKNSGIGDIPDELRGKQLKMDLEEIPVEENYDSEGYDESAYGAAC